MASHQMKESMLTRVLNLLSPFLCIIYQIQELKLRMLKIWKEMLDKEKQLREELSKLDLKERPILLLGLLLRKQKWMSLRKDINKRKLKKMKKMMRMLLVHNLKNLDPKQVTMNLVKMKMECLDLKTKWMMMKIAKNQMTLLSYQVKLK